jgi:hypothetical protein
MFVRFRETDRRLQASLVETRRSSGKVRLEHIAGLGSVPLSPSPAHRITFWTKLHQRLDALNNRVNVAQRGAILTAVHARIPMPTMDDQQAVQLEHARADARFWETLQEMHTDDIQGQKELLSSVQRAIAAREPLAADTAAKTQAAKDRLARVEKGESVADIGAPLSHKDSLRISGMTEAEAQHCVRVAAIADRGWFQLLQEEQARRRRKAEKAVVRELHRRLQTVTGDA